MSAEPEREPSLAPAAQGGIPTYPCAGREKIISQGDPLACGAVVVVKASNGEILTWVPVKNLKPKHKKNYRRILVELYGEDCSKCSKLLDDAGNVPDNLDHLDRDLTHNCLHNFPRGRTHQGCNAKRFWEEVNEKVGRVSADTGSIPTQGERGKSELSTSDYQRLAAVARHGITPSKTDAYSNKKNHRCHKPYRLFVFRRLLQEFKHDSKPEIESLNEEGAEFVGEETNTTMRYMDRILAKNGPCDRDPSNDELILFRELTYYYLTEEELLEVFPVEGQMSVDWQRVKGIMEEGAARMSVAPVGAP